jgi:hypothetical protein
MMGRREVVFIVFFVTFVPFVNFVRNGIFYQVLLVNRKISHKAH